MASKNTGASPGAVFLAPSQMPLPPPQILKPAGPGEAAAHDRAPTEPPTGAFVADSTPLATAVAAAVFAAAGVAERKRRKAKRGALPIGAVAHVLAEQSFAGKTWAKLVAPSLSAASFAADAAMEAKSKSRSGRLAILARRAMFERFTEKSMKAVMMAQAESRKLGHDHVGPEMLLVGIVAEGSDAGARALALAGVELAKAREALEEHIGRGAGGKAIEIPFTQGAKQVLEDAIEKAHDEGSPNVGTVHLLHAILLRDEGAGVKLLNQILGVDTIEKAREKLRSAIAEAEGKAIGNQAANVSPGGSTKTGQARVGNGSAAVNGDDLVLTETLKFATDLTAAAREGRLDPLIGREPQLERTIRILGRRSKNNPVLVGEAGVGKTSIAHGLAQRIHEGRVPAGLLDKRVLQLDLALLLAGTRYRGDFEERLRAVVGEVTASERRVILVIDEVHTLVGAGSGGGGEGGGIDAANLLKPALARGELQCIGATTLDEYRSHIEKDPALERRFQPVLVPEPSEDEAEQILAGLAPRYEKHHQLKYDPQAIRAAVQLASRYISDRYLPDKAIDVMDEAGSKVRQHLYTQESEETQMERQSLRRELEDLRVGKKAAITGERYDEAQEIKMQEGRVLERLKALDSRPATPATDETPFMEEARELRERMVQAVAREDFGEAQRLKVAETALLKRARESGSGGALHDAPMPSTETLVTTEDVAQVVAGWTGIAVETVSADESARLLGLEGHLTEAVIGQDEAVRAVSRALRRARAGLRNPTRPIAGLMFSGPTGVGKTELCKTLAQQYFGSPDAMIRLDMSEFMEKHTVSKLIGAPPGYVGYNDGGTLTEAVRRKPYSLVLFDEVEKAHPDVFNLLLQLLDDGRLTDSKSRTVSFSNTLVVMTSNIGSRAVQKGAAGGLTLGFAGLAGEDAEEENYNSVKEQVHEEMKGFFRPEFLNRLDETVVFRPLSREDVRAIAEVEVKKVLSRLTEMNMTVSLTDTFKEKIASDGFDPAYGARPLRRAVSRLLEDTLAEHVLAANAEGDGAKNSEAKPHLSLLLDVGPQGEVVVTRGSPGDGNGGEFLQGALVSAS